MHTHAPLVIIGTGLAGYNLAKEFRKLSAQPLMLITQDDGHFYSKPQLSTALQNQKTPEALVITSKEIMQQQLDAQILTFSTVTQINFEQKSLIVKTNNNEETYPFSQLVFATGSHPKPLPLFDNVKHFRVNSLMDYCQFRTALSDAHSILVLGSGLVGCEFAHDLTFLNKTIHVVTPEAYPLSTFVPEIVGRAFQNALQDKGINWHTQRYVTATQGNDCILNDGSSLSSDLILIAVGLSPAIALAQQSGLDVNQGIVVDAYLKTNMPDCYALGDCAEINQICRQFIAPIMQCTRALARTLSGQLTPAIIPPTPIVLKTSVYPIVTTPPYPNSNGSWTYDVQTDGIHAQYLDTEGMLLGYCLSGQQVMHRQQLAAKLKV